jgi:hypothetical protein
MPSKHTVVVSLDQETEKILENIDGNRSEWIRDAIRARVAPPAESEIIQALADARKRRIRHLEQCLRRIVKCVDKYESTVMMHEPTRMALRDAAGEIEWEN